MGRITVGMLESAVDAEDTSGLPAPVEPIVTPGGVANAILEVAKGVDLVVVALAPGG